MYYEGLSWGSNMVITYCTEGDTSYELASPNVIAMLCASLILGIFAANKVANIYRDSPIHRLSPDNLAFGNL